MTQYFKDIIKGFREAKCGKKIFIISLIVLYFLFMLSVTIPVNYELVTPGSPNAIVSTKSKPVNRAAISIETDNQAANVYTVGVRTHKPVTAFQYFLARLSDDVDEWNYNPREDFNANEDYQIGVIQKTTSISNAIIVAYDAARDYEIATKGSSDIYLDHAFAGVIVANVRDYSRSYLKVNDLITKVNGTKITSSAHFSELLAQITGESYIEMTVIRNDKEITVNGRKVSITTETGEKKLVLGISIIESHYVNSETASPKFSVSSELQSIGSSGGAMTALAIFETLIGDDFIGEKQVMGTGTIDLSGKIGEISGVQQKVLTAQLYGCHVFFVAAANYEEAKSQYDTLENPSYELVKVSTFTDIIEYLEAEGAK